MAEAGGQTLTPGLSQGERECVATNFRSPGGERGGARLREAARG